jgi:hypothetical protein
MSLLHDDLTHFASRLRVPTAKNIEEDLELLRKGILDHKSFFSGYSFQNHPVEVIVHDAEKKLKAIRRTHNLRTNKGAHDQGVIMTTGGSSGGQYLALSDSQFTPNATDTALPTEISAGGLGRVLATFAWSTDPSVTNPSQAFTSQGSYTLTSSPAGWTASTSIANVQACGVFNAASGGDMWFESTFGPVSVNSGDTIQLTYTINF